MDFGQYLAKAGLPSPPTIAQPIQPVGRAPEELFTYRVPELTPDGTCSIGTALASEPYDLRPILSITTTKDETQVGAQLAVLHKLLNGMHKIVQANWIGIYQAAQNAADQRVLVKLAYQGAPSRAEFPLTQEFAALSNNSTVGLTGKAIVIRDVATHSGPYYTCDTAVQSEICLPIFDTTGKHIIGIIDAESFHKNHFTRDKIAHAAQLCHRLTSRLPVSASK